MIKIRNILPYGSLIAAMGLNAQILEIDDCYNLAKANFPLVKQYELIEKSRDFSVENAQKAYLPQFGVYGQVTHQSDVTQFPFDFSNTSVPGLSDIKMPALSKDQNKIYGEISYSLTNLATNKNQTDLVKANAEVETQKIEVELYKLRERINSLFFGILLIDAQIAQLALVKKDIQTGIDKTEVAIENGVAVKSAADNLKAELLKIRQRTTELQASRKGYADMLSLFINRNIDEGVMLERPLPQVVSNTINRPELLLYDLQNKTLDIQNQSIRNKNLPGVSLFVQGGFGKPALNILSNDFEPYYITGVRLSWNLSGYYTAKNERRQIAVNQAGIRVQQETFLFNTDLALFLQNAEITKMQGLIVDDDEIIRLLGNVKNTTQTQLESGTATTNDYLTAVNAEDQAQQNRILHEIQLLTAQYNANTTSGN